MTLVSRIRSLLPLTAATFLFAARIALAQLSGNIATTPVPRTASWWIARHQQKLSEVQHSNPSLVFVGDSITQNYESLYPDLWNQFFSPHQALNLGFSGDETQHLLWRIQNGELQGLNPANVVLLIGTNNTARGQTAPQVTAGIIACVEDLHRLLPTAKILILNILPTAITQEKSTKDKLINRNINHHYAHSPYAQTLDLTHLFETNGATDPTLFYDPEAPLHPNVEGQRRMAEAVLQTLYPRQ